MIRLLILFPFACFAAYGFNFSLIMDVFIVGTLNVNRAREAGKWALAFDTAHIDVLFLQEVHSDGRNWEKEWERQATVNHNTTLEWSGLPLL